MRLYVREYGSQSRVRWPRRAVGMIGRLTVVDIVVCRPASGVESGSRARVHA